MEGRGLVGKEGRKRERKREIIMSQNPRKEIFRQDEVIKEAKASRESCHHSPEHRELSRNSLEMGITILLKRDKK